LQQAEADIRGAQVLLDNGIYHLACFVAQQTAEKALKAYLYTQGEEVVTGHSVARLCSWAAEYNLEFKRLKEDAAILDGFYIPTRYPNGLPDSIPAEVYNKKTALEAVEMARYVMNFVRERL